MREGPDTETLLLWRKKEYNLYYYYDYHKNVTKLPNSFLHSTSPLQPHVTRRHNNVNHGMALKKAELKGITIQF